MSSFELSEAAKSCIFRQDWWLDALAGKQNWGQVSVTLKGKQSLILPYVVKKMHGFTVLTSAPLTQTLGPLITGIDNPNRRLSLEKDLYYELVEQLPSHDAFNQNFHRSITNWLPLYWKGFEQSTRYTYRLENIGDIDSLWNKVMPNIKGDIKKAVNRFGLHIDSTYAVDRFLDINEMTFQRQGKKLPYPRELVYRLDSACESRNCRKIFYAQDDDGLIHAAIYLVWDDYSAYYLMGGGNPELRNSGATSLAMWEAIKFASTVTRSFDFEGSMLEPVERFFRGFAASQVPYYHIWKFNSRRMAAMWHAKKWLSDSEFKFTKEKL